MIVGQTLKVKVAINFFYPYVSLLSQPGAGNIIRPLSYFLSPSNNSLNFLGFLKNMTTNWHFDFFATFLRPCIRKVVF
jgi:hypothetical protein